MKRRLHTKFDIPNHILDSLSPKTLAVFVGKTIIGGHIAFFNYDIDHILPKISAFAVADEYLRHKIESVKSPVGEKAMKALKK